MSSQFPRTLTPCGYDTTVVCSHLLFTTPLARCAFAVTRGLLYVFPRSSLP